jgi:hypothetical protein
VADGLAQLGVKRRGGTVMRFWAPSDVQALIDRKHLGMPSGY